MPIYTARQICRAMDESSIRSLNGILSMFLPCVITNNIWYQIICLCECVLMLMLMLMRWCADALIHWCLCEGIFCRVVSFVAATTSYTNICISQAQRRRRQFFCCCLYSHHSRWSIASANVNCISTYDKTAITNSNVNWPIVWRSFFFFWTNSRVYYMFMLRQGKCTKHSSVSQSY